MVLLNVMTLDSIKLICFMFKLSDGYSPHFTKEPAETEENQII